MSSSVSANLSVVTNRNFLLLWAGQGFSVLGDQFAMIGLPWLVLQLTGDPLALGAVLALQGAPRALFMLLGGALTDRFSARTVMLVSDLLRMLLFALLGLVTWAGLVQIWMLYIFALAFGLVSGFFNPASGAIVPRLVNPGQLRSANALIQATAQLSIFIGPAVAGGLIALLSGGAADGSRAADFNGIALAFVIDALSFLISALTLFQIRGIAHLSLADGEDDMLLSIRNGLRYVWQTPFLRIAFLLLMVVNLLCVGPLEVGIPVLVDSTFQQGVVVFGLIMAAYGGGNLAGILLAGLLPRPPAAPLRWITVGLIIAFGMGLIGLSWVSTAGVAIFIALAMGSGNGYLALLYITLIQQQSPKAMLGRMMSLLMLANLGLTPLSQAAAGVMVKLGLPVVFIGAGALIVLVGLWSATRVELLVIDAVVK